MRRVVPWVVCAAVIAGGLALADESEMKEVLEDHVVGGWIYDDIEAGYRKARETGKPLLVAFR